MTRTPDPTVHIDQAEQERPVDLRSAWERVAYAWLAREVDANQPVDPTALAAEVSVAPDFAHDLLRLLRAHRERDPDLAEQRARLVCDRITDAYLRQELHGDQRLDPTELAAEVGTTTTIARQWLAGLRPAHHRAGLGGPQRADQPRPPDPRAARRVGGTLRRRRPPAGHRRRPPC